jgi:hypothetical protein
MKKGMAAILCLALMTVVLWAGDGFTQEAASKDDLCSNIDQKPVLSLQQIRQAELVHYLVVLSGQPAPSPEGKSPEQFYNEEVQLLMDLGYPPSLAEIEPDRLVTRRYFASIIFQVLAQTDAGFAAKHGSKTSETEQLEALVEEGWLYSEEGRIYREEILSILCRVPPMERPQGEIPIEPIVIMNVNLEVPLSPI